MSTSLNEINHIDDLSKNIGYLQRDKVPHISQYMTEVIDRIYSLDYYFEGDFDALELTTLFHEDLPECSDATLKTVLIDDMVRICEDFSNLIQSKNLRIQVEVVDTDKCRLFHVDYIKQRLTSPIKETSQK